MCPGLHVCRSAVALAAVAAALSCMVAVSPAAATVNRPPCTRRAIAAGLRRGTNKTPGATIEGFRCAGRFTIAVVVWERVTVPALLRARGARWVTVNREIPCKRHEVPKKIYAAACLAS